MWDLRPGEWAHAGEPSAAKGRGRGYVPPVSVHGASRKSVVSAHGEGHATPMCRRNLSRREKNPVVVVYSGNSSDHDCLVTSPTRMRPDLSFPLRSYQSFVDPSSNHHVLVERDRQFVRESGARRFVDGSIIPKHTLRHLGFVAFAGGVTRLPSDLHVEAGTSLPESWLHRDVSATLKSAWCGE